MNNQKTVWITGASSGLGLHTSKAFQEAGWIVISGARTFKEQHQKNEYRIPLDVTDKTSIDYFFRTALKISARIDAVIHCAGILVLGSCEETSPEEYLKVINTNFIGIVRLNQIILPVLRNQHSGRIIMFSSINGLLGIPFQSAYTASKHAIEGYAECLKMEVTPFGIQVMLIEPGDHQSGSDRYRYHSEGMGISSPYEQEYLKTTSKINHDETNGSDPDRLGKIIVKMMKKKHLPFRKKIASPDQRMAVYIHRFMTGGINAFILRLYYLGYEMMGSKKKR